VLSGSGSLSLVVDGIVSTAGAARTTAVENGTSNELRGYAAGKYLDRYMVATQLEYRLTLPKGLGLAGFGGIGEVIPGSSQVLFKDDHFLPSMGGGPRDELRLMWCVIAMLEDLLVTMGQHTGSHLPIANELKFVFRIAACLKTEIYIPQAVENELQAQFVPNPV